MRLEKTMFSTQQLPKAGRRGQRLGLLVAVTLGMFCLSAVPHPVLASAPDPLAAAFSDDSGFKPMDKTELADQRGGFDGIAFGIFLSGTLSQPVTSTLPPGLTVATTAPNQVQIVGGIGNLAGANGIFQFTNVVGNMNVINNNIIINVSLQAASPTNTTAVLPF
jgi:hypothetical protein